MRLKLYQQYATYIYIYIDVSTIITPFHSLPTHVPIKPIIFTNTKVKNLYRTFKALSNLQWEKNLVHFEIIFYKNIN